MSRMKLGTISALSGAGSGWVELALVAEPGDEEPPRVFAKLELRDGYDIITRLVIDSGGGIRSSTLRALPIARLEAYMGQFGPRRPVDGRQLADDELTTLLPEHEHFVRVDASLDAVIASRPTMTAAPNDERGRREPLNRPNGTDPDAFSRRVAEAYAEAVTQTSRPATLLAAEAGVPAATVRRWILEARRRGHIPPARKGRAG